MFKQTRRKLTIVYTISFLILLYSFIAVLYFFITRALDQEQINELEGFTHSEMNELIEHLDESEHENDLEYKPERALFYYVFDKNNKLVDGEETLSGFKEKTIQELKKVSSKTITVKTEWHKTHVIFQLVPIKWNNQNMGTVVVGKEITNQYHFIRNILIILTSLSIVFTFLLAFLSYFLAGKAMGPIQDSYEKQKKFVSDASHELRTPLSIFLGSVDLLEREETERLSPIGREVVQDLRLETMHMKKLLENLLLLSRSDQKQEHMSKEQVNLSSLLPSICHRFQHIVPDSLQLTCNIDDGICILADSIRIQQLIYILLENALHYTEAGEINVTLTSSQKNALIKISDTGQGIDAQDLPHIFDRFYRADDSRDRSGLGLGLSIAKMIVENHHGNIQVISTPRVGTTFSITLPIK